MSIKTITSFINKVKLGNALIYNCLYTYMYVFMVFFSLLLLASSGEMRYQESDT